MILNKLKTHFLAGALSLAFFVTAMQFTGCVGNTEDSASGTTMMKTTTEMQNTSVTGTQSKSAEIASGFTSDSVVIGRARILIASLKLENSELFDSTDDDHHDGDKDDDKDGKDDKDDNDDGDDDIGKHNHRGEGKIKIGPFIAEFTPGSSRIISNVAIPFGTYDEVEFVIHQLDDKKDSTLLYDPIFSDFVNGGRYTAIIEGKVYIGGIGYDFVYKSKASGKIEIDLDPPVTFDANTTYNLALVFDPVLVFARPGLRPLDPRDPDNSETIEKLIKKAIKALRK
jgi:hypothetical protein